MTFMTAEWSDARVACMLHDRAIWRQCSMIKQSRDVNCILVRSAGRNNRNESHRPVCETQATVRLETRKRATLLLGAVLYIFAMEGKSESKIK